MNITTTDPNIRITGTYIQEVYQDFEGLQLNFNDLRNDSSYEFFDVTSEEQRTYWKSEDQRVLTINNPVAVAVSKSGHRVLDSKGLCYFITANSWNFITWSPKPGSPHFVK